MATRPPVHTVAAACPPAAVRSRSSGPRPASPAASPLPWEHTAELPQVGLAPRLDHDVPGPPVPSVGSWTGEPPAQNDSEATSHKGKLARRRRGKYRHPECPSSALRGTAPPPTRPPADLSRGRCPRSMRAAQPVTLHDGISARGARRRRPPAS